MNKIITLMVLAAVVITLNTNSAFAALSPAQAKARAAAKLLAKEISRRDRASARKLTSVIGRINSNRSRISTMRRRSAANKVAIARAVATNASNVAALRAEDALLSSQLSSVKDRVTELERRGTHLCHGIEASLQDKCLETLNIKEREITSRSKTKEEEATSRASTAQQEKTKRKGLTTSVAKQELEMLETVHTGCKNVVDRETDGVKTYKRRCNSVPSKGVKYEAIRSRSGSSIVTFSNMAAARGKTPRAKRFLPRVKPVIIHNHVVGTPDVKGFTPPKGWSTGAVYGTSTAVGFVAGGVAGYLSGKPLQVDVVDGEVVGETAGTQTRNMLIGMLLGPVVTNGATAAWRAATSD
jgi:hypothetical protein